MPSPSILPIFDISNHNNDIIKGSLQQEQKDNSTLYNEELCKNIVVDSFPNPNKICLNKISVCSLNEKINEINHNLITQKLSRFVFPRFDPPVNENWHIDSRTPTQKMFDILCNSLNLLNENEFAHWNTLCSRNYKYQEKSKLGLYCTYFDIKDQQRLWKASQSKHSYAEQLGSQDVKKLAKSHLKSHFGKLENGYFYNPCSAIDMVKIQRHSMSTLYKDYMGDAQQKLKYFKIQIEADKKIKG